MRGKWAMAPQWRGEGGRALRSTRGVKGLREEGPLREATREKRFSGQSEGGRATSQWGSPRETAVTVWSRRWARIFSRCLSRTAGWGRTSQGSPGGGHVSTLSTSSSG